MHNKSIHNKNGQAMIEFMAGLIAILAVTSTMIVSIHLLTKHTNTMVEARKEAGEYAIYSTYDRAEHEPEFIKSWETGPDEKRHTRDDEFTKANVYVFEETIVEKTAEDTAGWNVLDTMPDNSLSELHNNPLPASYFGLVKGESEVRELDLTEWPAFIHLIYGDKKIEIKTESWLTWTKGIY